MTYKIYSRLYAKAKDHKDLDSFISANPSIQPDDLKTIYLFASNPIKSSISAANMSQRDFAAEYGIPLRSIENWSRGASEPPTYLQQLITYAVFTNQRSVSRMNVLNKMEEIYGSELSLAAVQLCNDEDADIIKSYQASWDAGESFTQAGMSTLYSAPRAEDSEEEIIACVDALYQALILAVKKHWASALSRNEAVTLCNTLLNAPGGNGVFTICKDAHVSCYDLAEAWNSAHPNDEQIEYHPASII